MKLRKMIVLVAGLCAVLLGIAAYSAVSNILAVGTIQHSELFGGPASLTVRQFIIAPGETLPWYYHPGVVYVTVKRGTLTHEEGCGKQETFVAGQAFEKLHGEIHRAKNLTSEEVELYDTFIIPQGLPTTVSTLNNQRLCGPPTSGDSCKKGGWANFTFPGIFRNQGECEQYVNTGKLRSDR